MHKAIPYLVAVGAISVVLPTSTLSVAADAKRHYWSWSASDNSRGSPSKRSRQKKPKAHAGKRSINSVHKRPFGNFGVGPDSYSCFGYDCNW